MSDSTSNLSRWICKTCGWIYDESKGDPDSGIAPGTPFEDIPDDWYCPLCGVGKADFITLDEYAAQQAANGPKTRPRRARGKVGGEDAVVIVGSGIAGWTVAERLRERDPGRPITLITADDGCVYPKPTLSMAIGQGRDADQLVETSGPEMAARLQVTLQANTRVLGIKPERKRLTTAKGNVKYGDLVLALGASQIRLPIKGDAADEILRINDLISYRNFRQRLDGASRHVTVIGAGLIGTEYAEELKSAGHRVTLLDLGEQMLGRLLPAEIARELQGALLGEAVEFRPGISLKQVDHGPEGYRLQLSDGRSMDTDMVISAVGLAPNTDLARKAGLAINRGILAEPDTLQTSAAHVYALGDCVEVHGRSYHYIEPIKRQARTVAAAIVGQPEPFAMRPSQIRVKTPGLPLNICPPDAAVIDFGAWHVVAKAGRNVHMEFLIGGQLGGYALSGDCASQANELYKKIVEQPPSLAKVSWATVPAHAIE